MKHIKAVELKQTFLSGVCPVSWLLSCPFAQLLNEWLVQSVFPQLYSQGQGLHLPGLWTLVAQCFPAALGIKSQLSAWGQSPSAPRTSWASASRRAFLEWVWPLALVELRISRLSAEHVLASCSDFFWGHSDTLHGQEPSPSRKSPHSPVFRVLFVLFPSKHPVLWSWRPETSKAGLTFHLCISPPSRAVVVKQIPTQ